MTKCQLQYFDNKIHELHTHEEQFIDSGFVFCMLYVTLLSRTNREIYAIGGMQQEWKCTIRF
jgi:hypothetical protein